MRRVLVIVFVGVVVFTAAYSLKAFTPPIFAETAIAELVAIDVNGDRQWLLIRGQDRRQPVLLFLHGGPGMPAMYLAHAFQRELERDFVMVHWDQRASGKSFRADIDPATLRMSQLLDDTEAVIEYLRERLDADKVLLVGHSHGSRLGALFARRHPELLHGFVGVGQVADAAQEAVLQDAFLRTRLSEFGLPEAAPITGADREELLFRAGSELHGRTSFLPLVLSGLKATEYNLVDTMNVAKGSSFSSRHMRYDVASGPLLSTEVAFTVPVAMVMGRHDMVTPVTLAEAYFAALAAPDKVWYLFDESAHFPFYEEPVAFTNVMRELKARFVVSAP